MYDLIAKPLQFFYGLWPNYAGAISLLTLSIMIILLPLTLKGTRSMLAMQKLQPELKKLQNKHRDDRQKLNEEVMKFYKENNINPMSGCLPLILQMPVFFILYRTLFELLNRAPFGHDLGAAAARAATGKAGGVFENFGNFRPKHLDHSSALYQDLSGTSQMDSFGMNLAESAQQAFGDGLVTAAPFLVLVLGVTASSYYQQRQIAGRATGTAINPQQQMLMKILPLFFAFISLTLPAGIVVYFLVSNMFRIAQQAFITRTMYNDGDGVVATTGREVDDASTEKPKGLLASLRDQGLPSPARAREDARAGRGPQTGKSDKTSAKAGSKSASKANTPNKTDKPSAPTRTAAGPSRSAPSNANRSRTKKKRK